MKRVYLTVMGLLTQLILFAQRERLMPEDYSNDYSGYTSSPSDDKFVGYIALFCLIIGGILILWFKSALNSSRKAEIRNKTLYLTNTEIKGFNDVYRATTDNHRVERPKEVFTDVNGVVAIPKYARCIILEYYSENRSYVKVKFEDYPQPLYIGRWYLRTPEELKNGK